MHIKPIDRLHNYLQDPVRPTWSSQGLTDLFKDLSGEMKGKQLFVLPIIDERFSIKEMEMTEAQFHFLRAVTLHAFHPTTRVEFSLENLNWLFQRFEEKATQQRAALIAMLIDINTLPDQLMKKIKHLLKGTLAEPFILP